MHENGTWGYMARWAYHERNNPPTPLETPFIEESHPASRSFEVVNLFGPAAVRERVSGEHRGIQRLGGDSRGHEVVVVLDNLELGQPRAPYTVPGGIAPFSAQSDDRYVKNSVPGRGGSAR